MLEYLLLNYFYVIEYKLMNCMTSKDIKSIIKFEKKVNMFNERIYADFININLYI